jgi:uncharacterized membrane protein
MFATAAGRPSVDPISAESTQVWAHFLTNWPFWNHVRTIACTMAMVLFIYAIAVR